MLAWSWLVAVTLALSPPRLVTRGWVLAGIAAGLGAAFGAWTIMGRPRPPAVRSALASGREALQIPVVAVLAVAVTAGALYAFALGVLIPVGDWDALAYHLARAAFWKQEHAVGYVPNAPDSRLNVNPPNAEIGQLATMLLSGVDRYVVLPQFAAYAALVVSVAGIARRTGLTVPESVFGALAFGTLPVVIIQSTEARNDLVVAAFLTIATVFVLRPGRTRLLVAAIAIGLAIGTKFTAVLCLPALVLIAVVACPRRWPAILTAGGAGLAIGSSWYIVNLVETGDLDGGIGESAGQRAVLHAASVAWTATRLLFNVVDMSGAGPPYSALFYVAALVLAAVALARERRTGQVDKPLLGGALLTAGVAFIPALSDLHERALHEIWLTLGEPGAAPVGTYARINLEADAAQSWYGPLGLRPLRCFTRRRTCALPARSGIDDGSRIDAGPRWCCCSRSQPASPGNPWRGRFFVFGVALAAAAWGVLLRWRVAAGVTVAIATTSLLVALANHLVKPSGVGQIVAPTTGAVPIDTEHLGSTAVGHSDTASARGGPGRLLSLPDNECLGVPASA